MFSCGQLTTVSYMKEQRHTTASGWPRRGDLAHDAATGRAGVVIALPEDTGAPVFHLRPDGGAGEDWTAKRGSLTPADTSEPGAAPEGAR